MTSWKKLEDDTAKWLRQEERTEDLSWLRLYDTRSARGGAYIPNQPGDFIITYGMMPLLVECKYSDEHEHLNQCFKSAITENQAAQHRVWNQTGKPSIFIFKGTWNYEVWHGGKVAYCHVNNKTTVLERTAVLAEGKELKDVLTGLRYWDHHNYFSMRILP